MGSRRIASTTRSPTKKAIRTAQLEGFWKVQLGNVYYYVREIKNTDVVERYARDIEEGWWDRHVFKRGSAGTRRSAPRRCAW